MTSSLRGELRALPLTVIRLALKRLRGLDEAKVAELAGGMRALGQLQPIGVRAVGEEAYELVFGAHRVAAARRLEQHEIDAVVFPADAADELIRMAEIDENLIRNELGHAMRAKFTAERKRLWQRQATDVVQGDAAQRESGQSLATLPTTGRGHRGFAAETAARTGRSKSSVNQAARFGEVLGEELLDRVAGTDLDQITKLDALCKLDEEARAQLVDAYLAAPGAHGIAIDAASGKPSLVKRDAVARKRKSRGDPDMSIGPAAEPTPAAAEVAVGLIRDGADLDAIAAALAAALDPNRLRALIARLVSGFDADERRSVVVLLTEQADRDDRAERQAA